MVRQKRIRTLGRHVRNFTRGDQIVAALRIHEAVVPRLIEAGFTDPIETGQSVLPSAHLGLTAQFNAEGKDEIHRDRPKETVYRSVEWTHDEWHGPYTERKTEIVARPYDRYPRTFVKPPSVELTVRQSRDGTRYVCAPARTLGVDDPQLLHDVNLVLDIEQECELLSADLVSPIRGSVQRLNWEVLPRGRYPWNKLRPLIRPTIERLPEAAKPVIEHRLEQVAQYPHDFVAIGRAGFAGYVIFAFPTLGIYVLECTHEGNATYVFGEDWKELSQWTKAEVLGDKRHLHRLIHSRHWRSSLGDIMRRHGYGRE